MPAAETGQEQSDGDEGGAEAAGHGQTPPADHADRGVSLSPPTALAGPACSAVGDSGDDASSLASCSRGVHPSSSLRSNPGSAGEDAGGRQGQASPANQGREKREGGGGNPLAAPTGAKPTVSFNLDQGDASVSKPTNGPLTPKTAALLESLSGLKSRAAPSSLSLSGVSSMRFRSNSASSHLALSAVKSAPGGAPLIPTSTITRLRVGMHQYRPDFWSNLPLLSKLFVCAVALNVLMIMSLVILDFAVKQQTCACGGTFNVQIDDIDQCPPALRGSCRWQPQSLYLGLIVVVLVAHHFGFSCGAVIFENTYALLASCLLVVVNFAVVIYYTVSELDSRQDGIELSGVTLGTLTAALQLVLLGLAASSYRQMGWRTYSKCAADMRVKDADKLRQLYVQVNIFTTHIKLDFMTSLLVVLTSLTVWIDFPLFGGSGSVLLAVNFILWPVLGFVLDVSWLVMSWLSVRKEKLTLGRWASWLMPFTLIWGIASFIAVVYSFDSASTQLSNLGLSDLRVNEIVKNNYRNLIFMALSVFSFLVQRVLCCLSMRHILSRYGLSADTKVKHAEGVPELRKMQSIAAPIAAGQQKRAVHADLAPLIRGAWIGKPSPNNSKKKRFFQLSSDGTTLRWAWDKYILMLYVEDVAQDEETLEVKLTVTAEPDLTLRFDDPLTFQQWAKGFKTLLAVLLGPEGLDASPAAWGHVENLFRIAGSSSNTPTSEGQRSANATPRSHSRQPELLRQALKEQQQRQQMETAKSSNIAKALGALHHSHRHSVADPKAVSLQLAKERVRASMDMERSSISQPKPSPLERDVEGEPAARHHSDPADTTRESATKKVPEAFDDQKHRRTRTGGDFGSQLLMPICERSAVSKSLAENPPLKKSYSYQLGTERHRDLMATFYPNPEDIRTHAFPSSSGEGSTPHNFTPRTPAFCGTGPTTGGGTAVTSTCLIWPVGIDQLDPTVPIQDQLGLQGRVDEVEIDNLQLGKFLGAGAEGVVFAAWYNETPVAVKKTTNVHEVQMHVLAGSHDNIVSARGVILHEGELHLVMEYCPRGTLDTMIHHTMGQGKKAGPGWDPVKVVLPMVRSIARGLLHLHKRAIPILHRDLKPGNIFVGHGLVMKIGDFGMSRQVDPSKPNLGVGPTAPMIRRTFTTGVVGTSVYSAPEVLAASTDDSEVDTETMLKADVYSFGVTLWEILSRKRPHEGLDHFEIQTAWIMHPLDMQLPPVKIDQSLTPQAAKIMATLSELSIDCTQIDPRQRPSFKEIVARIKMAGATESNV